MQRRDDDNDDETTKVLQNTLPATSETVSWMIFFPHDIVVFAVWVSITVQRYASRIEPRHMIAASHTKADYRGV